MAHERGLSGSSSKELATGSTVQGYVDALNLRVYGAPVAVAGSANIFPKLSTRSGAGLPELPSLRWM